jgi:hypothetical protein
VKAEVKTKVEEKKNNNSDKQSKLNQEVCELLGDYLDQDQELKKVCDKKGVSLAQGTVNDATDKIYKTLTSLDADFKKCEKQIPCLESLDKQEMDNAKTLSSFIS